MKASEGVNSDQFRQGISGLLGPHANILLYEIHNKRSVMDITY